MSIAADAAVGILRSKSGNRIVEILARRSAAGVAACVVILAAGVLSAVWAFVVPIFQAPDEPAHFDYAISIYSEGRLVRASDGPSRWIVSPYTRYLMKAVDFDRIKGHSSMRVPPGYGSREFFAKLDQAGPKLGSVHNGSGVSYVASLYPFVFYGLEALVIKSAAALTGSLSAAFFAARLFCVALMMVGLTFGYLSMLKLGIRPWLATGVLAATGFFPLTSLVSSYVQPDNLTFATLSATLFFAACLRRGCVRIGTVLWLGLSLGMLAVSKYQFFLSAAPPCVLILALALNRTPFRRIAGSFACISLPPAALLATQHWFVASPLPPNGSNLFLPIASAFATGLAHGTGYTASMAMQAFWDFFLTGTSAASYWAVLGWLDAPLVIGNDHIQDFIRLALAACSLATAGTVLVVTGRDALRLLRIALTGRAYESLRLAAADPLFNGYAVFVAIMMALYIASNNAFGAEGRHWYPYVVVAFLCFVRYAPRLLTGRRRQLASALTCAVLLAYSATAAAYAMRSLSNRYYGSSSDQPFKDSPVGRGQEVSAVIGKLWPVDAAAYHVLVHAPPETFAVGSRLHVQGVVLSAQPPIVGEDVAVILDGHTVIPSVTRQYDYRMAAIANSVQAGYSGFDATLNTACLLPGRHGISAYTRITSGARIAIKPRRFFFLTGVRRPGCRVRGDGSSGQRKSVASAGRARA